jgi:hypothetical protein
LHLFESKADIHCYCYYNIITEVIAIILIKLIITTVVSDEGHVPGSQKPFEEPGDDPSGKLSTGTPGRWAITTSFEFFPTNLQRL